MPLSSLRPGSASVFFFKNAATTEPYTLSLHDALPISTLLAGNVIPLSTTLRLSDEMLTPGCNCTPFASSSKVPEFTVLLFNGSEKLSTTLLFKPIPVAPSCGVTATTAGPVVSTVAAVVKPPWKKFAPFPATSVTALVLTRTVTGVFPGSGWFGVNVTTAPFTLYTPATSGLLNTFSQIGRA